MVIMKNPCRRLVYGNATFGVGVVIFAVLVFGWTGHAYTQSGTTIDVNPIESLDGMSIEDISAIRKALINRHEGVGAYPRDYTAGRGIFGGVRKETPWLHDTQFFVLNPYLLVVESPAPYINALMIYCGPASVTYSKGKIEALYKGAAASCWFERLYGMSDGRLRLWFVNANDAGYPYAQLDLSRSRNVFSEGKYGSGYLIGGIFTGRDFYHVGRYRKNNISPADRDAEIRLAEKGRPTRIFLKLWKKYPQDEKTAEDFEYVINVEP